MADVYAQSLARKKVVDDELRDLRVRMSEAKHEAWEKGVFLPPREYLALESRIAQLRIESQGLQHRLALEKLRMKQENIEASNSMHVYFRRAAKEILPRETFEAILLRAEELEDDRG